MTSKTAYQNKQQEKAIQMVTELLKRLKRRQLIVEEQGWWQAGSPERFTFRVTATTENNSEN
jgi:P2-related tail formation protein